MGTYRSFLVASFLVIGMSLGLFLSAGFALGEEEDAEPTIEVDDLEFELDESGTIQVTLNVAPDGLSGASMVIPEPDLLEFVEIHQGDILLVEDEITEDGAEILAVDFAQSVGPGDEDILLFELDVNATDEGMVELDAEIGAIQDDDGVAIDPAVTGGAILVGDEPEEDPDPPDIEPPYFDVIAIDAPTSITEGDTVDVEATIENTGDETDAQTVALLDIAGSPVDEEAVDELAPNETETVTLSWDTTSGDVADGHVTVQTVNTSQTHDMRVEEEADDDDGDVAPEPDPAFFDVSIADVTESVDEGETITVDVDLTNTGDETAEETISLIDEDGEVLDSIEVDLAGDEEATLELTWSTEEGDAGERTVLVDSPHDHAMTDIQIDPSDSDFEIMNIDIDTEELIAGESIEVYALVHNEGEVASEETIEVTSAGNVIAAQDIELDPGAETEVTFEITLDDHGEQSVQVGGVDAGTIEVLPADTNIELENVAMATETLQIGDELVVTVDVHNAGESMAETDLELLVDDDPVTVETIELPAEDETAVTFQTTFDDAGEYEIAIDDVEAGTVTVEAPVSDLSVTDTSMSTEEIVEGDAVNVTATITNEGDAAGEKTVDVTADGETIDEADIELESGTTDEIALTVELEETGEYAITVAGVEAGTVTVQEAGHVDDDTESTDDTTTEDDDDLPGFGPLIAMASLLISGLLLRGRKA